MNNCILSVSFLNPRRNTCCCAAADWYGPDGGIRAAGDVLVPDILAPAGWKKLAGTAPMVKSGPQGTYLRLTFWLRPGGRSLLVRPRWWNPGRRGRTYARQTGSGRVSAASLRLLPDGRIYFYLRRNSLSFRIGLTAVDTDRMRYNQLIRRRGTGGA